MGLAMNLDEAEWRRLYGELLGELGSQGIETVECALLPIQERSKKRGKGLDLGCLERFLEGDLQHSCNLELR